MDLLEPLPESNGHKFILILVDAFTKFVLLYPTKKQDTDEAIRVTKDAVSLFGVPKLVVVVKGRMFESSRFVDFVRQMGIDLHYITMHNANGQVERYEHAKDRGWTQKCTVG